MTQDAPLARAERLSAILLQRPDVNAAAAWLSDFGLTTVSLARDHAALRGAAERAPCVLVSRGEARYLGMQLAVATADELDRLAQASGAAIEAGPDEASGRRVRLLDPDGIVVEAVHGAAKLPALPLRRAAPTNHPRAQPRVNEAFRAPLHEAPPVYGIGHTVLGVRNIERSLRWYRDHFGLIVSDVQVLRSDAAPVVAFLRCDRGAQPSDHHSVALSSAVDLGHMHTAFEVASFDDVALAHDFLRRKGWKHSWGIGRHILGSQIFDYWRDPWGDMFEHFADGDVFDASVPAGEHAFGGDSLHQWGPPPSADMIGKVPSLARARTITARLRDPNDDLTLKRLRRLMAAAR